MAWKEPVGNVFRVRYYHEKDTITVPIKFATEQDALNYMADMESDKRRGRWIDPADGRMSLREWAELWMQALDVEPRTEENYEGLLRNSILPRWGECGIGSVTALDVALWRKELRARYAVSTIDGILCLLSMMMEDAVDQRMIEANPVCRKRRRADTLRRKLRISAARSRLLVAMIRAESQRQSGQDDMRAQAGM